MQLVNIGFDNAVMASRIVAVVAADPSPIKRLREAALRHRKLVDATNGRRTPTVIITDWDHVVLSSLQLETVIQRLNELTASRDLNGRGGDCLWSQALLAEGRPPR
jgi:hypothetical protein